MNKLDNNNVKWWYQAINHGTAENPDIWVHEVYFNTVNKQLVSHTVNPSSLQGYESKDDVISSLELIIQDLKKSDNKVLEIEELNELFKQNE